MTEKNTAAIYIIAAPSGTGKTSLVKALVKSLNNIITSISYTTRPKRIGEENGTNYFFISQQKFKDMIVNNEFLEFAQIFGNYYGTSKHWVTEQINKNTDVILEIDWQGARQIKKLFTNSVGIFILPPSVQELRKRLKKRNQDNLQVIQQRLAAASEEISHCSEFDYIIINDNFDKALADLRAIINSQRLIKGIQMVKQCKLLAELIKT